jgi:hypothetical protein
LIELEAMNTVAFAQHSLGKLYASTPLRFVSFFTVTQARDHIALERLDNSKQYEILLANADKHALYRAHFVACGRTFKWNLLGDSAAAALRTAMYGDASTIDNGYISDDDLF